MKEEEMKTLPLSPFSTCGEGLGMRSSPAFHPKARDNYWRWQVFWLGAHFKAFPYCTVAMKFELLPHSPLGVGGSLQLRG